MLLLSSKLREKEREREKERKRDIHMSLWLCVSISLSLSHTHSHIHSLSLSVCLSLYLSVCLSLSLSLSLSYSLSLPPPSLSLPASSMHNFERWTPFRKKLLHACLFYVVFIFILLHFSFKVNDNFKTNFALVEALFTGAFTAVLNAENRNRSNAIKCN